MKTVLSAVILLLALAVPAAGQSVDKQRFSPERFKELQAAGEVVVLDVFADWCPTCAKQQELLAEFRKAHPDVRLHVLEIDFDTDKNWVREFRAPRQSTLIVYKGERQVWFSVAETRRDVIFEALQKAAAGQ
jgi:thioredoxin 1